MKTKEEIAKMLSDLILDGDEILFPLLAFGAIALGAKPEDARDIARLVQAKRKF